MTEYVHMHQIDHPVIPVTLYQDEAGKWKKRPLVEWDRASTDEAVREGWWRVWPDALPGIPLRLTDLVVVDADTPEAVEEMRGLRMLGPHSKIETPSGGLHLVFAQPPERIGKLAWSEGIEVLGESCLLTCYDLEELRFPRVAPRAVLPEMFWRPRAECGFRVEDRFIVRGQPCEGPRRVPINKERLPRDVVPQDVASLTDALLALDPVEWRHCHDEWLSLMNAAKWLGIADNDFVRWSLGDPHYAADERVIRRKWDSLSPAHGGALYAALSERGIKVSRGRPLIDGHPSLPKPKPTTTRAADWRIRFNALVDRLRAKQDPDKLFWVACRVGEMMIELKRPKPGIARQLLVEACPSLDRDEVHRVIGNAFHHVEKAELE